MPTTDLILHMPAGPQLDLLIEQATGLDATLGPSRLPLSAFEALERYRIWAGVAFEVESPIPQDETSAGVPWWFVYVGDVVAYAETFPLAACRALACHYAEERED